MYLMKKLLFNKTLIGILAQISERGRRQRTRAIPGILFAKPPEKKGFTVYTTICGCAFPRITGDGCSMSAEVSRVSMSRTIADIYKQGYIPVGIVMISSSNWKTGISNDKSFNTKLLEYARDAFSYIYYSIKGSFSVDSIMMVIGPTGKMHYVSSLVRGTLLRALVKPKVITKYVLAKEGSVAWISHDNWASLTLEAIGQKRLQ